MHSTRLRDLASLVPLLWLAMACPSGNTNGGLDGGEVTRVDAGSPDELSVSGELGAKRETDGSLRFRVASARATRLEAYLYSQSFGADERLRVHLEREPGSAVWSGQVGASSLATAGLTGPVFYGYRAWGPNWLYDALWAPGNSIGFITDVDADGNRFNPNKLLIDPYARELSHDPLTPVHQDSRVYLSGNNHRLLDSGRVAPKGVVLAEAPADFGPKPTRSFKDEIIYEVHLRGLTMLDPGLTECRGTYRAAAQKADYLASLGVTAIEFLPLHETANDANDVVPDTSGDNYWGYSSLSFFAPDRRYACDQTPGGPTREFQQMVKAFHARGLKVYLDVVYNHTAEGNTEENGTVAALLSWRGLDNAGYYQLSADGKGYRNDNGVSGNLRVAGEVPRKLITDSLRYWTEQLGVDGFRFDLASVLGNGCTQDCFRFEPDAGGNVLNRAVAELPVRPELGGAGVDLIAEPWGATSGTYQFGNFPPGWAEWNDQFRNTLRRAQNKLGVEPVTPRALIGRLLGSADVFAPQARRPSASVNYLASHDGLPLRDLYACNEKRNDQPWPFGPSDGGDNYNLAWDQGGDPDLQRQAARTGLALLMLSTGVPMITGGDELYRTQYCNNNVYNLDSEKNWLEWGNLTTQASFHRFARGLIQFRAAHPVLRPAKHFRGVDSNGNGFKDLTQLSDTGAELTDAYLDDDQKHFVALLFDGSEVSDSAHRIYLGYNGAPAETTATLPPPVEGKRWYRVADTAAWMEGLGNFESDAEADVLEGTPYVLHPRSLLLAVER